jgi:hypothetical protein
VKKSNTRTFSPRLEIRENPGFPLSRQPRRRISIFYLADWSTKIQTQTSGSALTYRMQKMVLTMGSTLNFFNGLSERHLGPLFHRQMENGVMFHFAPDVIARVM